MLHFLATETQKFFLLYGIVSCANQFETALLLLHRPPEAGTVVAVNFPSDLASQWSL